MRDLIPSFQTFRASLLHDSYVFGFSPLSFAFSPLSKRIFTASSPRRTFESRRRFNFKKPVRFSPVWLFIGPLEELTQSDWIFS
jgi:hypothetical protein